MIAEAVSAEHHRRMAAVLDDFTAAAAPVFERMARLGHIRICATTWIPAKWPS
ncbi:hypothetical protein ACWDT5_06460 [Rhodococcus aetherivorans]|uniref:hypothetical protein n=1 Tax=Rhodococcus TaxID=1827 RepID=UPI00143E2ADD|nr:MULTISPECIES: hypothetical protein [Rhodococcus]MDV6294244.1 hypothetical protein [Rhodococcus aetherivorans]QIX52091.1 hypothetical protein HFP48_22860 [Rhodococcus sp. DMU1]USC14578.1 hypothetical protein KZJ41_23650 [Rhodococcus sp. 11-3]